MVDSNSEKEDGRDYDIDGRDVVMISSERKDAVFPDAFEKSATEVKQLGGVTSNFKRRVTTLQKSYTGVGGAESKSQEEHIVTGYNAFEVISPPYNLHYLARLSLASPVNYAAIKAKTANIVGLGYDLVESPVTKRKFDNASDDQAKLKNMRKGLAKSKNDLMEFIDTLNEEDTLAEVLQKVWVDYEATGNGYIEISRIKSGPNKGQVGYIGHIPSTTIRVRKNRDGFVQIISDKAVFFRNFGKKDPNPIGGDANPNELIHIKKYAAGVPFYGIPDVVAAKQAVAGNEFASRFNLDYFENKAVPRHIVILKGATINPQLAKNILEFFETGLKGVNHRSLFVPLPADTNEKKVSFEFKPVEAGIQDASFNNYRKANTNEILMAHRVPITKVSVGEGVSLAVARDADKTFREQVCQPEQRILEKKLNRIIREFTDIFVIKLNEMALTDENTQSQIDERRRKTGVETANEQRARRGLPGLEGGDELVDLNAAAKVAEARNEMQASGNRERDAQRSAGATDTAGEGRNTKGDGRAVAN